MDKQKFLQAATVRKEEITVEGQVLIVREVSTLDFSEYGQLMKTDKLKGTAQLIAASVVDENGQPAFTEEEALVIANTMRVSLPIVDKVMKLSGMREEAEKHLVAN